MRSIWAGWGIGQGAVNGGGVIQWLDGGKQAEGRAIEYQAVVLKSFDQRQGVRVGHRGQFVNKKGHNGGRDERQEQGGARQAAQAGVFGHDFDVGARGLAAEFDDLAAAGRGFERGDQVREDIGGGDGLGTMAQPARADHERELFGDEANHFEGDRAGADDDSGAKFGDGQAGFAQGVAAFEARFQVQGQPRVGGVGQPAHVDDVFETGGVGGPGKIAGRIQVEAVIAVPGGHAVD